MFGLFDKTLTVSYKQLNTRGYSPHASERLVGFLNKSVKMTGKKYNFKLDKNINTNEDLVNACIDSVIDMQWLHVGWINKDVISRAAFKLDEILV